MKAKFDKIMANFLEENKKENNVNNDESGKDIMHYKDKNL
jgi:hypothetical protein